MATYHDHAQELKMFARFRDRIIIGLLVALALALWGWYNAGREITVYYPPNITLSTVMKAGAIPEETVYSFVPLVLQQLFLWEKNGEEDYANNRARWRAMLTERYQRTILDEINQGKQRGTMRGVTRRMQVLPTSVYNDDSVQIVGNSWLVWLDVEVTDAVNKVPINTSVRRLGVRVVRYDVNRDANPWQLAIDGIEHDIPLLSEQEVRRIQSDAAGAAKR
jgi:integrating conjugative element protein (TIGR03746 family)